VEHERRRILELVEQGRISAQEANELLGALEEPGRASRVPHEEHRREPHRGSGDWGCGGETMGVVGMVMRTLFRRREDRRQRQR
jgi:hypothetical protein